MEEPAEVQGYLSLGLAYKAYRTRLHAPCHSGETHIQAILQDLLSQSHASPPSAPSPRPSSKPSDCC
jgi:hypothetical protein